LKGKTETKKIGKKENKSSWAAAHWPPVQRAGCAAFQPAPLEAGHRSSRHCPTSCTISSSTAATPATAPSAGLSRRSSVVEKEDSRKREIVRTKKVEDRYYKYVSDVHQSNDLSFFLAKKQVQG
jgi:hypothetical protein